MIELLPATSSPLPMNMDLAGTSPASAGPLSYSRGWDWARRMTLLVRPILNVL